MRVCPQIELDYMIWRLCKANLQDHYFSPDVNHNLGIFVSSCFRIGRALPLFETALELNKK